MSSPTLPENATQADVFNQTLYVYDAAGDQYNVTLDTISTYTYYGIINSATFAALVGAAGAVLIVLVMLTKHEKRRATVFLLNSFALIFSIIASILQILYFTGPWYSAYAFLTGDFSLVPASSQNTSIAADVFLVLTLICLETSLVLQVKVVCVTLTSAQRLAVTLLSLFVAATAVGFRFAQIIQNIRCSIDYANWCWELLWLQKAMQITEVISLCFFSAAFCTKLGWALYQRHTLGLTQFGPMQIIFIGGCQTLFVPALLAILQFAFPDLPYFGESILPVTAIFLPLSSVWASASVDRASNAARGPDAHRKFIVGSDNSHNSAGKPARKTLSSDTSTELTSGGGVEHRSDSRWAGAYTVERDLEMQELGAH